MGRSITGRTFEFHILLILGQFVVFMVLLKLLLIILFGHFFNEFLSCKLLVIEKNVFDKN